jgi:hypothetical protein
MTATPTDVDDGEQSDGHTLEDEYGVRHGDDLDPGDLADHGVRTKQSPAPDWMDERAYQAKRGWKLSGHWWESHEDAEPPEWYVDQQGYSTVTDEAPQRCDRVPTPEVPEQVPWPQYTWYTCDGCGWPCIEHEDSEAAQDSLCWCCIAGEDLPHGTDITEAFRGGSTDDEVRRAVETAEQEASR